MVRATHFILAALFAAVLGVAGLAPARAATMPAGSVLSVDQASKPQTESVRYYGRRVHYGRPVYRRAYYHRPVRYYRAPVVYRRCAMRPRVVWTPYGYVRRWVRVCRY
ncbi:MAG: hypothetical protein CFE31_09175 [Rhizobiales bacterium PAR1]|nr:MAG: hypothetical protein CFE31_09175 [Rhizobiales bacterium PAR1]